MSEYRNRTTGEVKTQGEWRRENPNISLPRVWNNNVFDTLNIDPVLAAPKPTEVGPYQRVDRDGVVQDANGNWVENWVVNDMFADSEVLGTKAEQEAAYQATLDAEEAARVRAERKVKLEECDWVVIRAKELGQTVPEAWYTYRGDLRQIPEQEGFPHNVVWPTEPE